MPSKAKSKNVPAHQHDKRHESGLAAPGKRVVRQRSNQHLAGIGGKTAAPALVTSNSTTSTGTDHGHDVLRPPEIARQFSTQTVKDVSFEETGERDRTYSDASCEGLHCENVEEQQDGYYYPPERKYSVPARKGTLATISTILTYYPLRDAISILIILLSLPASVMLVVQTLFASLTFVPPSTGISLPSIKEMFNTSNMGYPALATILFVDLIFYLCWLIVWKPVQGVLLDLSQAVIAVSLSGAAASTGGPTYSIVTCSTLVCIVHLLRYKAIHLTAFDYLRSVLHRLDLSIDLSLPFSASSLFSSTTTTFTTSHHGWLYTTLRTLLGIHIVSQGVTTCIRRSLANANEKGTHVPSITKGDTEASAGIESSRSSVPSTPDLSNIASFPEGRSRASSPGPRDKTRESNTKLRKKQANEVRSKQPLWAAIASTKVTFVKEMEQRDAVDDAKEVASMDRPGFTMLPSTKALPDRIWVSEMLDTEVVLRLELSTATIARSAIKTDDDSEDIFKPFNVRMNGATWNSIRIFEDPDRDSRAVCYTVEIYGLAPLSSYLCEVDDILDDQPLASINLITSARTATIAPTVTMPAQLQPLRPTSPHSTLKKSIEQAELNLAETRNRSRKTKKDQKSAYSDIRREINMLKAKVDNSGGTDDRQARRLQQITQHRNQAEEATVQLAQQAHALGELPADEVQTAEAAKHDWQIASNSRAAAAHALDAVKADIDRESKEILSDVSAGEQKREKLAARLLQRKDELVAASARQAADLSARQKHSLERTAKREEQEKTEAQLRFHIASMTNDAEHWNNKAVDAYTQGQALSNWQTSPPPGYSAPATPDAAVATMNGHSYAQGYSGQYSAHAPRGRSSSMLSQYSGFTDDGDVSAAAPFEPQQQYTWPMSKYGYTNGSAIMDDGVVDGSSGSSGTNNSTASSSPRPDARTFAPTSKMSPIGPPRKEKNPSSPHANGSASPVLGNGR